MNSTFILLIVFFAILFVKIDKVYDEVKAIKDILESAKESNEESDISGN